MSLAERCATGSAKYVSQSPPFTLLQVFAVQIFALRRALAGWCLLCTLYRHSRNHWKKLLKIFGDIFGRLGCREVSEREKVVFRTLVEGCSEELFKDLRTLFACLRDKILEDSEENLRKSEWKIGLP